MSQTEADLFLSKSAALLRRMRSKVDRLDGDLVQQDIAARRQDALIGFEFAKRVDKIEAALKAIRSNYTVDQWCKETCHCDIRTMRRRKRLYKLWDEYEVKRREMGACGQTGLLFALALVSADRPALATNTQAPSVHSGSRLGEVLRLDSSRCEFITGNSLVELRKLQTQSVNVIVTSPPYWPAKRMYLGMGVGFEKTLTSYLANLAAIFGEAQRVLRDDGVLWICIDDSYVNGSLLFIPSRLGMVLHDDGWICRAEIIWSKRGGGRPDSVANRPLKDHEKVLMFTKKRNKYHYDGDPIRVPSVRPYSTPGRKKPGVYRRDLDRTKRMWSNPMGRSAGSVWEITPSSYRGKHAATMPMELVQKCLSVSCPEDSLVLDCFGGAGTTALVALMLGHRAISIEISPAYTKEARQRIARQLVNADEKTDVSR